MPHVALAVHFLALVAGAASMGQAVSFWLRHRKTVIRHYVLFLLSAWLILLALAMDLYGHNAGLSSSATIAALTWIFQAAGGLLYIGASPFFYHSLLGLEMRRWNLAVYLAIDAVAITAAIADIAAPGVVVYLLVLNSLLFGVIGLGLVLIAVSLGRTADADLRRALLVFLVLALAFFPLMWADAAVAWLPLLAGLSFLEGLPFPLYFLALNCLSIVFGLRYLNRPAYAESGTPTPYFLERFGITSREAAVIALLLEGDSGKGIADKLYISSKTVENHVTNIYRKVGARNRVQLFRLIRGNLLEHPEP